MKNIILTHVDTCLPDYWSGHHLPHVSIPVWRGMTLQDIKDSLYIEVSMDAITGTIQDDLTSDGYTLSEKGYALYKASIDALSPSDNKTDDSFFDDLEMDDDDDISGVYAYFLFIDQE